VVDTKGNQSAMHLIQEVCSVVHHNQHTRSLPRRADGK
jgi:hypothetical protein